MRDRLQLRIADIGIELRWEGGRLADESTRGFYEPFVTPSQGSSRTDGLDVRLRLHCGKLPELNSDGLIFDARKNHWRLHRSGAHYAFEFFATTPPHPRTQVALLSSDFLAGRLYVQPTDSSARPAWSLTRLMRPFGELLMINLLSQGRGVLLHALGVSDHGEGLLFVGASGAGKTTLGDLYAHFSDATVLGDERVIVTRADGQFWLSGTPWPGGCFRVSSQTVPLRKVFFLEHGSRNALIADSHLTLYGLLFQQLFLPFWHGEALVFAMRFVHEVLSTLPAYRLAFVNNAQVIEFLRGQESEGG